MDVGKTFVQQRSKPWSWVILGAIIGIVIAAIGFFWGNSSHQVIYQQVGQGAIAHYISGDDGTSYLQMQGSPALYIVHEKDFQPAFSVNTLGNGVISLIYNPEDTTDTDITSTKGTHLAGKAFRVLEITVFDNSQTMYITSDYSQHPNGYYKSHWGLGGTLLGIGILLAILSIFIPNTILTIIGYTVGFGVGAPIFFFLYIGFFEGGPGALAANLLIAEIVGAIGAVVGLITGIVQAARGEHLIQAKRG